MGQGPARSSAALLAAVIAVGAHAAMPEQPSETPPVADGIEETDPAEQRCDQDGGYRISEPSYVLTGYNPSAVWAHARGAGVRVAVIDSGLYVDNPHFPDSGTGSNPSYAEGTSLVPAWLNDEYEQEVRDDRGFTAVAGHGTAVAGIIAARSIEDSSVLGLAPESTIVPVQVYVIARTDNDDLHDELFPNTARLAEGIRWAVDAGVDLINVSMSVASEDEQLAEAVSYAVENEVLIIASAGAAQTDDSGQEPGVRYPAGYDGVIGVTALDQDGRPGEGNYAGPHVDVAAPGAMIPTPYYDHIDCYTGADASPSYAVPFVTATAALLAERYPEEGPELWTHRILMSAQRPHQSQRTDERGWGALSPYDALTMLIDPDRPGPQVPGHEPAQPVSDRTAAAALPERGQPWTEARGAAVVLVGGGAVAIVVLALGRNLVRAGTGRSPTGPPRSLRGGRPT